MIAITRAVQALHVQFERLVVHPPLFDGSLDAHQQLCAGKGLADVVIRTQVERLRNVKVLRSQAKQRRRSAELLHRISKVTQAEAFAAVRVGAGAAE